MASPSTRKPRKQSSRGRPRKSNYHAAAGKKGQQMNKMRQQGEEVIARVKEFRAKRRELKQRWEVQAPTIMEMAGNLWRRHPDWTQKEVVREIRDLIGAGEHITQKVVKAVKEGPQSSEALLQDLNDREDGRGGARNMKFKPSQYPLIDELIQTKLVNPPAWSEKVPITADSVVDLLKSEVLSDGDTISKKCARHVLKALGYRHTHNLKPVYTLTPERLARIETFIWDYDKALKLEEQGEHVIVYMDESYVHTRHARKSGWELIPDHVAQINGTRVQLTADGPDTRQGDTTASRGQRLIMVAGLTKDGLVGQRAENDTYPANTREKAFATPLRDKYDSSCWCFQANANVKDYHKNMDGPMFLDWARYRLFPAFEKQYPGKKMFLVLDNAPYHHTYTDTDSIPLKKLNLNKVSSKIHPTLTLLKLAEQYSLEEIQVSRKGQQITIPKERFGCPVKSNPGETGPYKQELETALRAVIKKDHPEKLMSDLQLLFNEKDGWKLIFTPPYCPKFQPIELLWRNTKQAVSSEWGYQERSIKEVYDEVANYWFGGTTKKRKVTWPPFQGNKASKLIDESKKAINTWIKNSGVQLSGTLGNLKEDLTKKYGDDVARTNLDDHIEEEIDDVDG